MELSHRNPALKLIIEFNPDTMSAAGVSLGEYFRLLTACGFTRISLIQDKLLEVNYPSDVPSLKQRARSQSVNLLCVKEGGR